MPVFFKDQERVVAMHIGWRGLQQKILSKYVKTLALGDQFETLYIGPHIKKNSFELDKMNAETLLKSHDLSLNMATQNQICSLSIRRKDHFKVSLAKLLDREATNLGFQKTVQSLTDTYQSPHHYSYRRNTQQTQRNYSYIIKI